MSKFNFKPEQHKKKLLPLLKKIVIEKKLNNKKYESLIRHHLKSKGKFFKKSELIAGFREFSGKFGLPKFTHVIINKIKMKPIRTLSGVVPVTLLTKPYPCPGNCLFCPDDIKMPKSYLSKEPGAQRALNNKFDPYSQVLSRLKSYYAIGHNTDKVELIILGGTWSSYPENYKIWFVKKCFDALNDFKPNQNNNFYKHQKTGKATLKELKISQKNNETANTRCVGLSLETRPDWITKKELIMMRKLGCTKVQIGIQSLDNKILKSNNRGHTIKETKKAIKLLRLSGFKIQAHWMLNLYKSNPKKDILDFKKLFSQNYYRPDELKIYPTALLETAPLMKYYKNNKWKPYTDKQLIKILVSIFPTIPQYCRVSRVIRDFSAGDIVFGSKTSNLREIVEKKILEKNKTIKEIRFREIRKKPVNFQNLNLNIINYKTSVGKEKFLQFITKNNKIAGFLRLTLPYIKPFIKELENSAIIRELHIYGQALSLGKSGKSQHLGLGKKLLKEAQILAKKHKFKQLSVIFSIGTKQYYSNQGFKNGKLYQHIII